MKRLEVDPIECQLVRVFLRSMGCRLSISSAHQDNREKIAMIDLHTRANVGAVLLGAAALMSLGTLTRAADKGNALPSASVAELMTRDLNSGSDKEVVMLTVTYPPAGASLPHRHDAQVFVYVLEGELTMQVRGSPAVTLRPGQTFYEAPDDVHVVSANASKTSIARMLVIMIKDRGKPGSRLVPDKNVP